MDILEFALDNAFVKMPDGQVLRQDLGIPNPMWVALLSPGMCIGTCAWMENEWLNSIEDGCKNKFKGARYMDDIILISKEEGWDTKGFIENFSEECYIGNLLDLRKLMITFSLKINLRLQTINSNTGSKTKMRNLLRFGGIIIIQVK
mgnify:CR=1 FL=1